MLNWFRNTKKISGERIYFDHASATPVHDSAKKSFLEILDRYFANTSSVHAEGEKSKEIIFEARKKVAKYLHTKSQNIFFTGSTTEANNIFIKGVVLEEFKKGGIVEIIYSKSDHSSIVETVESLKIFGVKNISIVPDKIGRLKVEDIVAQLTGKTKLICLSMVSSETGTIQEIKKISSLVREFWIKNNFNIENLPKIYVDATQAAKYFSLDMSNLNIDGLSYGTTKLGGVPGCAILYIKNGTRLFQLISGGGQEEGVRSGTENIPAIYSAAELLSQYIKEEIEKNKIYVSELRNYTIEKIQNSFKDVEVEIFGDLKFKYNKFYEHAAPHILLLRVCGILGEELCLRLDAKGISVSPATACSLLENSGSNFLKSIGEPLKAKETVRVSYDTTNTKEEIDYFIEILKNIQKNFAK